MVTSAPRGGGGSLHGDLLAVGALLAWSAYWLVSKRARSSVDTIEYTGAVVLIAGMGLTPVVFLAGQVPSTPPLVDGVLIVLLVGLADAGHLLINWAHRVVEASTSSVLVTAGVPAVATLSAAIILHEHVLPLQALGGGLAVVAVVVQSRGSVRRQTSRQRVHTPFAAVDDAVERL
jgi:drug/metabolite transporter (DMT)-like permease